MKNFIFFLSLMMTISWVSAQDGIHKEVSKKILTVTNDDDGVYYDLYIMGDEDLNAKGLKMYDRDVKDWTYFDIKNLGKGLVLKEEGSHQVIVLRSADFERDRGGHFEVDYLHNGITGKRKHIEMKFDFDGTNWRVFHRGSEVELLDFRVKKFFGKTIGIDKVLVK